MAQQWLRGNILIVSTFHEVVNNTLGRNYRGRWELRWGEGSYLYRSMRSSFRGWGTEMENRKISRGTRKRWTNTWRGNSSPRQRVEVQFLGRAEGCPMLSHRIKDFSHCYQGTKASHSLSKFKHLKQVWHRNKTNSADYNSPSLKSQMQRDPYFRKNTQRTTHSKGQLSLVTC